MATNKNNTTRWIWLSVGGIVIVLLLAGTVFAQMGPGRGGGGQGMMGPAGPAGPGGGPGALLGTQFLMQDPEVVELMEQIKVIDGINKFGLTRDQVIDLRDLAVEAQDITEEHWGGAREDIKGILEDQLDSVLAGNAFDPQAIRSYMQEHRENRDPGELRDELEPILDEAMSIFTADQLEQIRNERPFEGRGPGGDGGFLGRGDQGGRGGRFMDENRRELYQERSGDRMGQFRDNAARMKVMMLLLSPKAVDGMDLWLDYNG